MVDQTCGIAFDVNHTLIAMRDEEAVQRRAVWGLYEIVSTELATEPISRDEFEAAYNSAWDSRKISSYQSLQEARYEDVVAHVLATWNIQLAPSDLEALLQRYMQPLYDASFVLPGMAELLTDLRQKCPIAVITNYKYASGMREMLRRLGLLPLIEVVAISSEVGWKKPAPEIYHYTARELGVPVTRVALVANEIEKDLAQAKQLGMPTVYFRHHDAPWETEPDVLAIIRGKVVEIEPDFTATGPDELRRTLAAWLGVAI
jgi:putative hydrolase of the HAD superfamily